MFSRPSISERWPIAMLGIVILFCTVPMDSSNASSRDQAVANFKQADKDANGALTTEEFKMFIDLNASHGIGRAALIKKRRLYNMAFSRIDGNSDGIVTPDELSAASQ
ncbi:MAG: hypothetical protein ACR2O8_04705 [Rhizobiaceae bacterium]